MTPSPPSNGAISRKSRSNSTLGINKAVVGNADMKPQKFGRTCGIAITPGGRVGRKRGYNVRKTCSRELACIGVALIISLVAGTSCLQSTSLFAGSAAEPRPYREEKSGTRWKREQPASGNAGNLPLKTRSRGIIPLFKHFNVTPRVSPYFRSRATITKLMCAEWFLA